MKRKQSHNYDRTKTNKQKKRSVILRINFSTGVTRSIWKGNLRLEGKLKTLQQTKGICVYSVLWLLEETNKSFLEKRFQPGVHRERLETYKPLDKMDMLFEKHTYIISTEKD